MNYLSFAFAFFVIILLLTYYILPKKARPYILLCGSLFFYGCFALEYMPFLLLTAVSSFFCAKAIGFVKQKKLLVFSCVAVNFAVWFVVKDLQWAFSLANRALSLIGGGFDLPILNILVPVGISYYTLQALGYVFDVYRGKSTAETNFFKYLLFLSYFPAIVQGPISRYDQLMPELNHTKTFCFDSVRDSLVLVLWGLVKKMVIADRLGIFVASVFRSYADLQGVILYLGAVGYAFQLYFDFSGCVDICRGVSGLFGIDLVNNFDRPYLARSVKDFWGRWHISLSSWLKDYVYIPLGGNRKGTLRKYLNLLITFIVSGLWHGAGTQFVLWGILHAMYQIVGQATQNIRRRASTLLGVQEGSFSQRLFQTLITFHLVTLAWIFFRSDGIGNGLRYISNMFATPCWSYLFNDDLFHFGVDAALFRLLVVHIVVIMMVDARTASQHHALTGLTRQHIIVRWAVYWILLFDIILFGVYGSGYSLGGFMYGGF